MYRPRRLWDITTLHINSPLAYSDLGRPVVCNQSNEGGRGGREKEGGREVERERKKGRERQGGREHAHYPSPMPREALVR